jgi:hypothetical protein
LWRCGDGLFFAASPLASDAVLTTLHPLLENVLQTVDHFEICLRAPFSWLEKPRRFFRTLLRRIFGPKREEDGSWRKLHNDELHSLYSSLNVVRVIKSRWMRWVGHMTRFGGGERCYRVLVGRPEGKRPLGRSRCRWEDNIKMDFREIGIDEANWIQLAQDSVQWGAILSTVMNRRVP